jgi:hypothetical protein
LERHIGPLSSNFPCTAKALATGTLSLAFGRFSPSRKTPRSYLRGSMSLALTRVPVNFAHHGDCSEIRRCRLESGGLLARRVKIRAQTIIVGLSLLSEYEEIFSSCNVYALCGRRICAAISASPPLPPCGSRPVIHLLSDMDHCIQSAAFSHPKRTLAGLGSKTI